MSPSLTTSYFANYRNLKGTKISIARHNPQSITKDFEILDSFAPSKELLEYYTKEKSWKRYVREYKNEQRKHFKENQNNFINLLKRATVENIILCCYEKYQGEKTQCHRLLLYDMLKRIAKRELLHVNFIDEQ